MGGTRSRCGLRQEAGSVASCPTVKTAHPRETLLVGGADSSVPLAQFPQGRTRQGRRQRGRGGGSGRGQQSGGETAGCKPGRVVGPRRRGRPRAAFGAGCRQAREPGGVRPAAPGGCPGVGAERWWRSGGALNPSCAHPGASDTRAEGEACSWPAGSKRFSVFFLLHLSLKFCKKGGHESWKSSQSIQKNK